MTDEQFQSLRIRHSGFQNERRPASRMVAFQDPSNLLSSLVESRVVRALNLYLDQHQQSQAELRSVDLRMIATNESGVL